MLDRADKQITYSLTYRDVVEILKFVRASENCESFDLEMGDLKLSVTRASPGGAPNREAVPAAARRVPAPDEGHAPAADPIVADAASAGVVTVRAPVLGTFYRAPAPGTPPFVNVGDTVREGDTVGLIEVMKLFTPITAGAAGRVIGIVAHDAALVEYGQPLVLIEPL